MIRSAEVVKAQSVRQRGFTLVELMLAVTMFSVVMYMTLDSFTRQHKTSIITDQIVEVQNNVRAVSSLLEREVRMAGFMVGNAASVCGVDRTTGSDELFLSETEPIVPDDERAGTLGARLATGQNWLTTWPAQADVVNKTDRTLGLDSATTDLDGDGSYFYDNDDNGTPEADFRVGGGVIVGDIANPARGTACGVVIAASANSITFQIYGGQLVAHVASSDAEEDLVFVPAAHYRVNTTGFTTGRFERNGDLLAEGVDDFQISFLFDDNEDDVIDAGDERGATSASSYDALDQDNSNLKEVRFSIVIRTRAGDANFNAGSFIANENRVPIAGTDSFRRREIWGAVRPRNVGAQGAI